MIRFRRTIHAAFALAVLLSMCLSSCSAPLVRDLPTNPERINTFKQAETKTKMCKDYQDQYPPILHEEKKKTLEPFTKEAWVEKQVQEIYLKAVNESTEKAFAMQKEVELESVCVKPEEWNVYKPENQPWKMSLIVPSGVERLDPPNPQIDALIDHYWTMTKPIQCSYTAFQEYRRLQAQIPHDDFLLRTTIQQGLVVLYHIRTLINFHEGMEEIGCSMKPFQQLLKEVRSFQSDLADSQLPALMNKIKQSLDEWAWNLLQLELDVLSGRDVADRCKEYFDHLSAGDKIYDTAIIAWCGYALYIGGNTPDAKRFWRHAGQTVHDPDIAGYALKQARQVEEGYKGKRVGKVGSEKKSD